MRSVLTLKHVQNAKRRVFMWLFFFTECLLVVVVWWHAEDVVCYTT